MDETIVGRDAETAAVRRFLERVPNGPIAFVVAGAAGIGKTTVWLHALGTAEAMAYRILQARPAEAEARLSYAALADLLADVYDEARSAVPSPQQRALDVALLRDEADEPADPRTAATGLVGILTALAEETPVIVAVDDVQWLDRASQRALEFAVRRLPSRLGLLLTERTPDGDREPPLGLRRALGDDAVDRLVLGSLSLGALHQLLKSRLGAAPSRPTLVRLADASGGNPFYALEIARALPRVAEPRLGDPMPVPPGLQELLAARVGSLSAAAQEAVLVAASLSRPSVATVTRALGPDRDGIAALVTAEEAGVLVSDHERVRFTHPLLASAVYGAASAARRRQLHQRLAQVVDDSEERARHLAASVTGADEATAAELEEAARATATRGAQEAAAELFEAARRLTPEACREALARRTLGQAYALLNAGDLTGARALVEPTAVDAPTPALKVQALLLLNHVEWDAGAPEAGIGHLEECLSVAGAEAEQLAEVYATLARCRVILDPGRAVEHAASAERLLQGELQPAQLASVLIDRFFAEALLGRGPRLELLERGLDLERHAGWTSEKHPLPLIWFTCTDELDAARARHAIDDEWLRNRGEERGRGERLGHLALVELRAGRWELAARYADSSCAAIEDLDAGGPYAHAFATRSLIDAHRGAFERARATLRPPLRQADEPVGAWWAAHLLSSSAFVEFAAGDHAAADRSVVRMRELFDSIGVVDAVKDRSEPLHVESLLALGEVERAREALARLERRGAAFPRLWIDVALPRARALVLAAEGEIGAALAAADELDEERAAQLPFELARNLLVKGRLLRRSRQRRAAAEVLREAHGIFDRLGAPTWVEQAESELGRVAPRRRAPDELTTTELRVAELAAAGGTNREVAHALFLSPKTVEANLARVYRKLGIRSRAELGARMSRDA
jgi:DNA-binding CsgD family transcriptional regulator